AHELSPKPLHRCSPEAAVQDRWELRLPGRPCWRTQSVGCRGEGLLLRARGGLDEEPHCLRERRGEGDHVSGREHYVRGARLHHQDH
ncbi:unnamed protein product, partial [Ectocarpus fasciculatus]